MNRLRELRDRQGWTLKQVGEKMGMTAASICYYEKGQRNMTSDVAQNFAQLYGVTTDFIYGFSDDSLPFEHVRRMQEVLNKRPDIMELYNLCKDLPPLYTGLCIAMMRQAKKVNTAC